MNSPEVCAHAKITYRQLDHWTRLGITTPAGERFPGSGIDRDWSVEEAGRLRTISDLVHAGWGPLPASQLADMLREHGQASIAGRYLLLDTWHDEAGAA